MTHCCSMNPTRLIPVLKQVLKTGVLFLDIFSLKVDMNGFKPVLTDFNSEIPCIKFNLFTYPEFEFLNI